MKYKRIFQEEVTVDNDVDEFLLELPYVISKKDKLLPPLSVINIILAKGAKDSGMSGRFEWTPFQLSLDEYLVIASLLEKRGFINDRYPDWVVDEDSWGAWKLNKFTGAPADMYLELLKKEREEDQALTLAENNGDQSAVQTIQESLLGTKAEIADFLNKYQ